MVNRRSSEVPDLPIGMQQNAESLRLLRMFVGPIVRNGHAIPWRSYFELSFLESAGQVNS